MAAKQTVNVGAQCARIIQEVRGGVFKPVYLLMGDEPYYPVNDEKNQELFSKYNDLAQKEEKVIFGGRLAEYKYYDMAPIVEKVLNIGKTL